MKRITTLLIAVLAIVGLLPGASPAYALSFAPLRLRRPSTARPVRRGYVQAGSSRKRS
jgi:hypothetical protein